MVPRRMVTTAAGSLNYPLPPSASQLRIGFLAMKRASYSPYRRRAIHAPARKATSKDLKGAFTVTSRNWSAHRFAESDRGAWGCGLAAPLCSPGTGRGLEACSMPP